MTEKEEQLNIREKYGEYNVLKLEEFIQKNNINIEKGLEEEKVQESIQKYGKNEIKKGKVKNGITIFGKVL